MSVSPPSSLELASARGSSAPARIRFVRAAGAMALFAIGLLSFWPTTASLIEQWEDTARRTYTHGYFIAAIAFWLLWRRSSDWNRLPVAPSIAGFFALIATSIAWLVAYRAGLQVVHQGLLPAIIFFALATCLGAAVARQASFAFAFFYFAVPIWDALIPLLQSASVFATRLLLRVVGIPAYFSGNTFTMPAGSLEIADGCSGLHFFVVALAIALLYGEVNRDSMRTRVKLVIFAAVLAMVTNWLRIFSIAVAGHLTDMQHPLVSEEHYTFGWMMFVGAMVLFFLVARRWPVQPDEALPESQQAAQKTSAIAWPGAVLACAGLLLAPVWLLVDGNRASLNDATRVLPASVPGWSVLEGVHSDWQPVLLGADEQQSRTFAQAPVAVQAFTALYVSQRHGKELLGYDNSVTGAGLSVKRQAGAAGVAPWLEMEAVDARGNAWLLWYAYRIDAQWYRPGLPLQLNYGLRSLLSAPLSAVVAVRTSCTGDDCSAARAVLRGFAANAWPGSTGDADSTANDGR